MVPRAPPALLLSSRNGRSTINTLPLKSSLSHNLNIVYMLGCCPEMIARFHAQSLCSSFSSLFDIFVFLVLVFFIFFPGHRSAIDFPVKKWESFWQGGAILSLHSLSLYSTIWLVLLVCDQTVIGRRLWFRLRRYTIILLILSSIYLLKIFELSSSPDWCVFSSCVWIGNTQQNKKDPTGSRRRRRRRGR